jgi:putative SOS response-associated peptidase YedK
MCGRYPQSNRARNSVHAFDVEIGPPIRPETWNLSPTTQSLVVRQLENHLVADWLSWGLEVKTTGMKPINARVETAESKPMFRDS